LPPPHAYPPPPLVSIAHVAVQGGGGGEKVVLPRTGAIPLEEQVVGAWAEGGGTKGSKREKLGDAPQIVLFVRPAYASANPFEFEVRARVLLRWSGQ
jgi:hypothetical protein